MAAVDPSANPFAPRTSRGGERVVIGLLFLCGAVSVVTTFAIVAVLATETIPFFREIPLRDFFLDTVWQPFGGRESVRLGIWPLINGTMLVTVIGLSVAVPLGLGAATFLSEYATPRTRSILKPTLELLAGIPTVVLGFFALTAVTPFLRSVFGADQIDFFNSFSGGLVVGLMLIPTVASVSEDAMAAVPNSLREAAFGLGATRSKVAMSIVFPAALSGIVAAVILAMSRAVGETMIVALAVGSRPDITLDVFSANQTMTGYIAQAVGGEASRGSFQYEVLFAVGSMLFVMTLALNLMASSIVRRFRQEY
ncbi:MAG: phosphate transport system permease protein [Nitriliruptoraceae bacterium]|jgi:phosphate transport system permease protein